MPARGQQVESERRSRCSSRREACMSGQEHHKARQADGKQKRGRWLAHVMLSARPPRAKHLLCCHSAPLETGMHRQVRLDRALGAYHRLASASVTLSMVREDRRRICDRSRSHARGARTVPHPTRASRADSALALTCSRDKTAGPDGRACAGVAFTARPELAYPRLLWLLRSAKIRLHRRRDEQLLRGGPLGAVGSLQSFSAFDPST